MRNGLFEDGDKVSYSGKHYVFVSYVYSFSGNTCLLKGKYGVIEVFSKDVSFVVGCNREGAYLLKEGYE